MGTHTHMHTHIGMSVGHKSIKKTVREMRGDEKAGKICHDSRREMGLREERKHQNIMLSMYQNSS